MAALLLGCSGPSRRQVQPRGADLAALLSACLLTRLRLRLRAGPLPPHLQGLQDGHGRALLLALHPFLPRLAPIVLGLRHPQVDGPRLEQLRLRDDPVFGRRPVERPEVVRHGPLQVGVPRLGAQALEVVGSPKVDVQRDEAVEDAIEPAAELQLPPSADIVVDTSDDCVEFKRKAPGGPLEVHAEESAPPVLQEVGDGARQWARHLAQKVSQVKDEDPGATADA
mmetsp:Transcript_54023/g.155984  ORF Transcript_54023/g.155984 Transcript_54023/m.155984 type:complete len:225 (-) Transcript_54023:50-724(-)